MTSNFSFIIVSFSLTPTDSGIGRRGRDECLVPKKGTLPLITHVSGKTKSSRGFLLGCPLRI
jgi:hypothetical protein